MRRVLIACVMTAGLAGCEIGPNYKRPTVDVPQSYRYEMDDAKDTVNTAWWKQFDDPVLDNLIAEALAANWDVKIAAARVQQAAGVLESTRSALFPQFGYSADAQRQRLSGNMASPVPPTVSNPQTSLSALAGVSWEIDLWGRIRRLSESASANMLATDEARRGVILSLVAEVAVSYLQLRGLDEQLEISNRTLKTYGDAVHVFELRLKYGQASQMTLEQAKSQYQSAAAAIPLLQSQIAATENSLSILLGRNPGPIQRGRPLGKIVSPTIPAGLPSQLLTRRPDILQAEQNLIAANAQIGAAQALFFPTISLTGNYGTASADLRNLFRGPSRMWSFGGSIVGPIFTAGNIEGQVQQARANQQATLLAYRQTIQNGFADVENALVASVKLVEQLDAEQKRVVALREYARMAWLQYDEGYTPYLTVLYAQQQLFPAELNATQVRVATLVATVNTYKAMGGGWITQAEKMTTNAPSGEISADEKSSGKKMPTTSHSEENPDGENYGGIMPEDIKPSPASGQATPAGN